MDQLFQIIICKCEGGFFLWLNFYFNKFSLGHVGFVFHLVLIIIIIIIKI
jgi:hypothetical protein